MNKFFGSFISLMVLVLCSATADIAYAVPRGQASQSGTVTATPPPPPPPPPAPPQSVWGAPQTDKEKKEFCDSLAECPKPPPPPPKPVDVNEYQCEGPKWGEKADETSGPHNVIPGNPHSHCACSNPDFRPVAQHGTGKLISASEKTRVFRFTVICAPYDIMKYVKVIPGIQARLDSLEKYQAADEQFKHVVSGQLEALGIAVMGHGQYINTLAKWTETVDCTLYGRGENCKERGLVRRVDDVERRQNQIGGALGAGAFFLATPGGRMGGGMVYGSLRYNFNPKLGIEGVLTGLVAPRDFTSDTGYRGGQASILGGGVAGHLTIGLGDDPRLRLLLGPGLLITSRTYKGPHDEARHGYTVTAEIGLDIPLGESGPSVRILAAPAYGQYGRNTGLQSGLGGMLGAGLGVVF